MKVELVSKKIIKPSSPTPDHLRTYKLSFIDQLAPLVHTQILLFYPNNDHHDDEVVNKLERLKTSLSLTLTHFYPLAGRVKDNAVIECNDEGVEFCEAHVHGILLSDILQQPDADVVHQFLPKDDVASSSSEFLLKVQANLFECGGFVICVSMSHKIADASTIGSFIRAWSSTALLGCMTEAMAPKYILGSLYPSVELSNVPIIEFKESNCITRRFVFDSSKIMKLKAKAASKEVEQPTRVESVLGLLWKCATTSSRTNLGIISKRPSIALQVVNLRKRVVPPLPETTVGNFISCFKAKEEDDNNMELQGLVYQLRKGLEDFSKVKIQKLLEGNAFMMVSEGWKEIELTYKEGIDCYTCTSRCRFGFYEVDFGWGKPKWVSIPSLEFKNTFVLMDTSDGKGIEAWVALSEEDMTLLETNHELLQFASLNPSIV